ncbi:MAG: 5-(carboxyamino)imidazole ribonucleotide mutase [bacterium]
MTKKESPKAVGIVMGSESDIDRMRSVWEVLEEFQVGYEVNIMSAHRSPEMTARYAAEAKDRGLRVLIAGAGAAAHLAGVLAAHTCLPVIGVPLGSSTLGGLDALLATVQMPRGVPVATVAINGSANAGLLAVQILAVTDDDLHRRLTAYKEKMAENIQKCNERLDIGKSK